MRNHLLASALIAVVASLAPAPVAACGETLFRTGSGMRHNAQAKAPHARILFVADASPAQEAYRLKLFDGLRKAGHSVVAVSDPQDLIDSLRAAEFDLVVADQREVDRVLAQIDDRPDATPESATPSLIPVLARGERSLESFKVCLWEGASLNQFLRAVHQALRSPTQPISP